MTKVNIREALNQIDKDTDCKYDLVTLYEACNLTEEDKKDIAKMIADKEDADVIYDKLSTKYGKDVNFDDDDISDITLEECDMITDSEGSIHFDYLEDASLEEDTIKTSKGKWVNKGKEGTHGTFGTKKEADAQRRAMFASGWKGESFKESKNEDIRNNLFTEYQSKYTPDTHDTIYNEIKDKYNDETLATQVVSSLENDYKSWFDESLNEEFKTYYISYKDSEGKFKDKYVDLPIRATSKEEAEEKFLKDHPNIKSYDYKVISQESLKESVDNDTKELFRQAARDKVFSTHIYNHYPFSGAIELMDKVDENGEGRKLKFTSRDEMNSKADELLDNGYISYTYKRSQDESLEESFSGTSVMIIKLRSGITADGFILSIKDSEGNKLFKREYSYGYNASYNKRIASPRKPYVTDIIRGLISTYNVNHIEVTKGKNIYKGTLVDDEDIIRFKKNYLSEFERLFDESLEESNKETLTEASYGGAYDIADDEYFTKDDGMEAVAEILSIIRKNIHDKEFPDIELGLSDMDLDNRMFRVTLTDEDENEFTEEVQIDMRKIRHPLDLIKKYVPLLAERLIKQIKDYYSEM